MAISVVKAVSQALARTRYVLFTTFSAGKWVLLAFCAFLSQCDSGGGSGFNFGNVTGSIPAPPGGVPPAPTPPPLPVPPGSLPATFPASMPSTQPGSPTAQLQNLAQAWANWISSNVGIFVAVIAVGMLLGFGLTALLSWISCRGRFMLIDGIVHNRGAVAEPWSAFKQLGNSLFGWSFAINFLAFGSTIFVVALSAVIALPDIRANQFGTPAILGMIIGVTLLIASTLAFTLVRMLLNDFVVPAMYLHNLRVRPAWQLVKREIISGYVGEVVLFYLMSIALAIATMAIGMGVSCATCCVTALPFVGTVILLPLIVFRRCYGLCFIEQFGPRWTVFFDASQRCRKCGYDLRYTPSSPQCPECGEPRENWTAPPGIAPPMFPQ